ncbi:hypothetical protein [Lentzea flava]|uniref:Uncharacterized protein n=1 Tax=Lentzea flava TaxID=103732 RepID=A0ABQ2VCU4_9PSEU|nr:hypothetical protein [Lentzea flava]MCP2204707.1 hypothetical protein [Lentzea flava]GGU80499.1 hypothetical protein GCM10010178_84050 [Lentzea flava]
MAPVEFTVSGGEGTPLEFAAALVATKSLLVVTYPGGWAQVSRGLAVGRAAPAVVTTRVRVLRLAVLDLRHFPSASALPSITDVVGDVVALHDTRSWDTAPVVQALRRLGRPVVLFTAVHSWVPVDPASAFIGWSAPYVVIAEPRGVGEGRVEDALWQFRELERRRLVRFTALPEPPPPDDRAVTVMVALPGATEGIAGTLRPGADYEVWVHVGQHAAALPCDLELRAVLSMNGRAVQSESFVLPAEGSSPWVSFPVTTPYASVPWSGELVIYSGVVPVHVQQVVLPVGAGESHSTARFRLSRTFADLAPLSSRVASIMVLGERALVASGGVPSWISLDLGDLPRSLPHVSGLDPWYGKDFPAFCEDLAALARQGSSLCARLFGSDAPADRIRRLARAGGRPAGLMIADLTTGTVPWSLIYDLPFQDGPYRLCASVGQFGPFGAGGEVPAHCPVADHSGNVLCPFGFWGLSCVLEQPVGPLVPVVSPRPRPFEVSMAVDHGMDRALTERHVTELMSMLPPEVVSSAYVSPSELGRSLADESMDVVHLHFREGFLDAEEIERWDREGVWPRPHWPSRKPLVVGTSPMTGLVRAFSDGGASAVISPETVVPQDMAGWVTGVVLARLAAGFSAGEALRLTRWEMIGRGNVMGLAYTLHGNADLRLR